MRFAIRVPIFVTVSVLVLLSVVSLSAQQINYPNFLAPASVTNLQLNGSSRLSFWQLQGVLRLTDGSANAEGATTYFNLQQPVTQGFTTWFKFQIHNPTQCCNPADGFAFILQNSSATDSTLDASGSGLTALGTAPGGIGYTGINNSLAVEFDISQNAWDPNSNHAAIQTCGGLATLYDTPVHLPGQFMVGQDPDVTSCLLSPGAINTNVPMIGGACNGSSCSNGVVHQAVIQYTPPNGPLPGSLQVWLDPQFIPGTHTPVPGAPTIISVPYNIVYNASTNPKGLSLPNNVAWVGFTASQPAGQGTTQDILAWEFTPHGPSQIQQVIPPGGVEADYVFGNYQMAVTYPTGFQNPDGILMTVVSTPVNRNTFYTQRLLGTQFANESCIVYLETGGNCVVHSVTCQTQAGQQIPCPSETDPTIAICSEFTTTDPVTANNADYLEAEPIGSNNWFSIFSSFSGDPVVSGRGRGFSDVVATFVRNRNVIEKISPPLNEIIPKRLLSPGSGICPPVQ